MRGCASSSAGRWPHDGYDARMIARRFAAVALLAFAAAVAQKPSPLDRFPKNGPLVLQAGEGAASGALVGAMDRAENPAKPDGRHISLHVVVIPATAEHPLPDPVVLLAGGPGQAATTLLQGILLGEPWLREQRDVVLVDQRGTGGSNPLQVPVPGSKDDPQGYLDSTWNPDVFRRALAELQQRADLTQYTTALGMDDVDAVCTALGYQRVNLIGGSYGTRAALIYMRRHQDHVRCAILDGCAPIAFKNPLYHAAAAQAAFDALRQECLADPECKAAFGDLADDLKSVLARLKDKPADVEVEVERGEPRTLKLSRDNFAESLRHMLYDEGMNRQTPMALHAAAKGDLKPFAALAFQTNRALHDALAYGLLMCVTNAEDLPRITEAEIVRETAGSFLGDVRVRSQIAIGAFWPRAVVENADEPVAVDTPVLLLSGSQDPVTPARFGAEAATHLPHSLHVVVPGCHGVGGKPLVVKLQQQFLERGSVDGLDTKPLEKVHMAKIRLPKANDDDGKE
jgi:pimeloyl-ACP methyl ester carboxylesterase